MSAVFFFQGGMKLELKQIPDLSDSEDCEWDQSFSCQDGGQLVNRYNDTPGGVQHAVEERTKNSEGVAGVASGR